jgi:hypothetical protein
MKELTLRRENAAFARRVLDGLARISRFDTNAKFLSRSERDRAPICYSLSGSSVLLSHAER